MDANTGSWATAENCKRVAGNAKPHILPLVVTFPTGQSDVISGFVFKVNDSEMLWITAGHCHRNLLKYVECVKNVKLGFAEPGLNDYASVLPLSVEHCGKADLVDQGYDLGIVKLRKYYCNVLNKNRYFKPFTVGQLRSSHQRPFAAGVLGIPGINVHCSKNGVQLQYSYVPIDIQSDKLEMPPQPTGLGDEKSDSKYTSYLQLRPYDDSSEYAHQDMIAFLKGMSGSPLVSWAFDAERKEDCLYLDGVQISAIRHKDKWYIGTVSASQLTQVLHLIHPGIPETNDV
jgi:hypothetical protein